MAVSSISLPPVTRKMNLTYPFLFWFSWIELFNPHRSTYGDDLVKIRARDLTFTPRNGTEFMTTTITTSLITKLNVKLHLITEKLNTSPGGVLKNVLYGEAPPWGPPLALLYTIFSEKVPLSYTFIGKKAPLLYTFLRRLMNKSLKQEVFLSFFSRSGQ